jgi:C4-dicarboxylate-specific signal transduction histidine kinase
MKMEPLDLNALIRETLDLLRAELLVRHVTPITELARSLPAVDGGSVQLQQVLINLVINAADAMSEKKVEERRLIIRTEVVATETRLCVIDNGSGIAADALPNIFDAFWSTKAGGMGIGLAICQSIAAAHHGRITASNNPQGGATFCVSLPGKHA